MSDPATARRFVCLACGYAHLAWAARCSSCLSLKGMESRTFSLGIVDAAPVVVQPPPLTEAEPQERDETPRPRLVIARAPSPEPELSDPVAELIDLGPSSSGPVPISEVPETTFVRDSTGLPPLDHVLGGGLVVGSVVVLGAEPGLGKCLGRGTPVLLYDGSRKAVENIQVGETLMGPDSAARRVVATGRGWGPLYRVIPRKGPSWVCNNKHVLTLVGTSYKSGQILDIEVEEFLTWTAQARSYWRLWRTGVEFSRVAQEIDPYLIGLWLGDGSTDRPEITSMDPEVIAYCASVAPSYGLRCVVVDTPSRAKIIRLAGPHGGDLSTRKNIVHEAVRACVHDGDKFIPTRYLIADREQRLSLLAGILDTDGCLVSGGFEITLKSRPLCEGILFLAHSLGFAAYMHEVNSGIKATGFVGTYQRLHISGGRPRQGNSCLCVVPTRIARKRFEVCCHTRHVDAPSFVLESIGEGDYYGFTLDGDGRFLLGDFTVTHNSSLIMQAVAGLGHRVLYASGEESTTQCAERARRIGAAVSKIYIVAETDVDVILAHARKLRAQTLVIDSIQTLVCADLGGGAGSPTQVRECTQRLVRFAKITDTTVLIIGHVTNDGTLAGPKTLKHLVDVVLEMEAGPRFEGSERIVRCAMKNRFGSSSLLGCFELTAKGLVPIDADGWNEEL